MAIIRDSFGSNSGFNNWFVTSKMASNLSALNVISELYCWPLFVAGYVSKTASMTMPKFWPAPRRPQKRSLLVSAEASAIVPFHSATCALLTASLVRPWRPCNRPRPPPSMAPRAPTQGHAPTAAALLDNSDGDTEGQEGTDSALAQR